MGRRAALSWLQVPGNHCLPTARARELTENTGRYDNIIADTSSISLNHGGFDGLVSCQTYRSDEMFYITTMLNTYQSSKRRSSFRRAGCCYALTSGTNFQGSNRTYSWGLLSPSGLK